MRIKLLLAGLIVNLLPQYVFSAKPAAAGLQICGATYFRNPAFIAVAYRDRSPSDRRGSGSWISRGWYRFDRRSVNGGDCTTIVSGDLSNRYYYYYVEGGAEVSGPHNFCVHTAGRFTFTEADVRCQTTAGRWRGFREIDTGDSPNYTINLSNF